MMEPWQRELLKKIDRTNELLELVVYALTPQKIMLGAETSGEEEGKAEALAAQVRAGQVSFGEQALAAAGIFPLSRPGAGQPETPEQRAERFAARAKEVGLADDKVEEVSGRVQLNLDTLRRENDALRRTLPETPADPFAGTPDGQRVAPAKKAPRKRTTPTA